MKITKTKLWEINGEMFAANTIEKAISMFYETPGRSPSAFPRYVKPVSISSGCEAVYITNETKELKAETFNSAVSVMDGEDWGDKTEK